MPWLAREKKEREVLSFSNKPFEEQQISGGGG
jgi:hypothetical protein